MEKQPNLEVRAQLLARNAAEAMSLPDSVYLEQKYVSILDGGFRLRVSATSSTRVSELSIMAIGDNTRTIHLERLEDSNGPSKQLFSLDVNGLLNDNAVDGGIGLDQIILDVVNRAESTTEEYELLRVLLLIVNQDEVGQPVSDKNKIDAEALFTNLLKHGATKIKRELVRKNIDGGGVIVCQTEFDGPLEHINFRTLETPRLEITVSEQGDEHQTVLHQLADGSVETFKEHTDIHKRALAYSSEENIMRNQEGQIIGVMVNHDDKQALIAAERALGMRAIDPILLEKIESYVSELVL